MTTQAESRLSRKIMTEIRLHGHFCWKNHGGPTMMAGLPDIIVCVGGRFLGLETKVPAKRDDVSERQLYVHEQIRLSGGWAYVVCSPLEALEVIDEVLNQSVREEH